MNLASFSFHPPLCLLTVILAAGIGPAAAQDTIYLDAGFRQSTASQPMYYGFKTRTPAGWELTCYYLTGKLKMTGEFADDSLRVRQGDFVWYDSSGTLTNRNAYAGNLEEGPIAFYYANGQLQVSGYTRAGKNDGNWIGYYLSGQVSGKATYSDGKQISAVMYHEDGSSNKDMPAFMRNAQYPGGMARQNQFISQHARYPEKAARERTQGSVLVTFTVSKEGKLSDYQISFSDNPDLNAEALRVVKLMPDWEPAIRGGIYISGFGQALVLFRLKSK
jgi:protein TonB